VNSEHGQTKTSAALIDCKIKFIVTYFDMQIKFTPAVPSVF